MTTIQATIVTLITYISNPVPKHRSEHMNSSDLFVGGRRVVTTLSIITKEEIPIIVPETDVTKTTEKMIHDSFSNEQDTSERHQLRLFESKYL